MDKYVKLQKIGQGSFGSAYLATKRGDPPTGRKYVIKEIRMDPRDQATALREAKLLGALDHPNIIACKESFLLGPQVLCIVTEFADGGDLRRALNARAEVGSSSSGASGGGAGAGRWFTEAELLDLFVQCCLALKHLHDRKIIHRDIKPENIFLTRAHVVKLGDFGVATVLSHTLACAETLTGTPYYTSPEICLGRRYNAKTDVWSLGCVLYELATHTHPFNGRSQRQLFENIIHGRYAPVRGPPQPYSPELVALIDAMLQKEPRARPSVNQLIRRPIVLARIQKFLSERAVADAMSHTILHGQHIFAKKQAAAVASPAPRAKQLQQQQQQSPASEIVRRAEAVWAPPKPQQQQQQQRAAAPRRARVEPSPPPRVRAVQYQAPAAMARNHPNQNNKLPKNKVSVAVAAAVVSPVRVAGRRNSLKAPGEKPRRRQDKPAVGGAARTPGAKRAPSPSPTSVAASPGLSEQQRRLLARKREIIAKAREDAHTRARRAQAAAAAPSPTPPTPPTPAAAPPQAPPAPVKAPSPPQVSDRIAAFNAQWQAQRAQLLNNLAPSVAASPLVVAAAAPPPALIAATPIKRSSATAAGAGVKKSPPLPPPPAAPAPAAVVGVGATPITTTTVVLRPRAGAKKPSSAAAMTAAKQREAMRRDIRQRKQALAGQRRAPTTSPLDDPVILVQNLPVDVLPSPPPPVQPMVMPPPPPPVAIATAVVAAEEPVGNDENEVMVEEDGGEDRMEEEEEEDDEDDADDTASTPSSSVGERANLEFQRMLLQLQSVVDDPNGGEEEEEEEEEEAEEAGEGVELPASPPPPPYCSVVSLPVAVLEDPAFKLALRARWSATGTQQQQVDALNAGPPLRAEQQQLLTWLHQYLTEVLSSSSR